MRFFLLIFAATILVVQACQPINVAPMQENMVALEPMAKTFVVEPALVPHQSEEESTTSTTTAFMTTTTSTTTTATTTSVMHTIASKGYELTTPSPEDFTVRWTCSSAMVQIETVHPWDPSRTKFYQDLLNKSLILLQHHSGNSLREFGYVIRKVAKVPSNGHDVFGELFFIENIIQPCDALREFVRKAVSWSKDIPRAVVACRCETAVEIYKVKASQSESNFSNL